MRKRYLLLLTLLMACLCSCHNDRYSILVNNLDGINDGTTLYLVDMAKRNVLDSAIVAEGCCRFSGSTEKPMVGLISPANLLLIVEPGKITVDAENNHIGGARFNDEAQYVLDSIRFGETIDRCRSLYAQLKAPQMGGNPELSQRLIDSIGMLNNELSISSKEAFRHHKTNIVGSFLFTLMGNAFFADLPAEEFEELVSGASVCVASYGPLQEMRKQIRNREAANSGKCPDFEVQDAQGHRVKLSSLMSGKITVIDIWATWCGPCRNEIQNTLIPLQKAYGSQGVQVIGLASSFRETAEDVFKCAKELGINYPVVFDADCECEAAFAVEYYPTIIIVDKTGNVKHFGLRGPAIETAIKEMLAQ